MNLRQPQNARVLDFLARDGRAVPVFMPREAVADPYYKCGAHPDIVERIWDVLGNALPLDCRGLVFGCPALVHPRSGLIFALATGTRYSLRLPDGLAAAAIHAGARTLNTWSDGSELDLCNAFGEDWVFGAWLPSEPEWCRQACEKFDLPAGR